MLLLFFETKAKDMADIPRKVPNSKIFLDFERSTNKCKRFKHCGGEDISSMETTFDDNSLNLLLEFINPWVFLKYYIAFYYNQL